MWGGQDRELPGPFQRQIYCISAHLHESQSGHLLSSLWHGTSRRMKGGCVGLFRAGRAPPHQGPPPTLLPPAQDSAARLRL